MKIKNMLFLLFLASSIYFYGAIFIPRIIPSGTALISIAVYVVCAVKLIVKKSRDEFRAPIFLFLGSLIVNCAYSSSVHGSIMMDNVMAYYSFFQIAMYFYLKQFKMNVCFLEKVVLCFAIFYCIVYAIQMLVFPHVVIDYAGKIISDAAESGADYYDRGTLRLRGPGGGFLMLSYFMCLNRYIIGGKRINLLFSMLFMLFLFLSGFRSLVALGLILSILMFVRNTKFNLEAAFRLFLLGVGIVLLVSIPPIQRVVEQMVEGTIDQKQQKDDDARIKELGYFLAVHPQNQLDYFLGSGMPNGNDNDAYSQDVVNVGVMEHLFWQDLGLLGLYIMAGLGVVVAFLWLVWKVTFYPTSSYGQYLKYYFIYLLFGSIASMEIYRNGIFGVEAIGLYLAERYKTGVRVKNVASENLMC